MLEREDQHMVLEYHRRPDHYTLNTSASYFDRHFQTVGTRGRALPLALHNPHALYPDPKTEAPLHSGSRQGDEQELARCTRRFRQA